MHDLSHFFKSPMTLADVQARPWAADDVALVGRLLATEWYPELQPEHALLTGTDQLLFNLSHATGAVVVERRDGTFLGTCLARCGTPSPDDVALWAGMARDLHERANAIGLELRPEPSIDTEGHELLDRIGAERGSAGVGEVELLFVAAEARGLGLGRSLMDAGRAYLRAQGASRVRLVTDDACGWGLYEHLGLARVGVMRPTHAHDPNLSIYAYEGML